MAFKFLPFKTTLFAAFMEDTLKSDLVVQPVSVTYVAPDGEDARFYGWWGDMGFGAHLLGTLAARRQGGVRVVYHAPLNVSDFPDRKAFGSGVPRLLFDKGTIRARAGLQSRPIPAKARALHSRGRASGGDIFGVHRLERML